MCTKQAILCDQAVHDFNLFSNRALVRQVRLRKALDELCGTSDEGAEGASDRASQENVPRDKR